MLYQSIRHSALHFKKRQKARQTKEQQIIFKWKFIVLGLGVILLILLGICSELIKNISSLKAVPINTTFLYSVLPNSFFFSGDISSLHYLINGLNSTSGVKFDNSRLLYSGNQTNGLYIANVIGNSQDLLVLVQLSDGVTKHQFGAYLHPYFPKIDVFNNNFSVNVTDYRDQLYSILFSLQNSKSIPINSTDSCFIYQYDNSQKSLTFLQLLNFNQNLINPNVQLFIKNKACFTRTENIQEVNEKVSEIVGFKLDEKDSTILALERLEIYTLKMEYKDFQNLNIIVKSI